MAEKYVTGIKPTGELHIGNYVSVIKPIIDILNYEKDVEVYFFIADYHALTVHPNPEELKNNIQNMMLALYSIFSTENWPKENKLYLYRQSKITSILEYYWILECYCAKGLLNRNHSYKQLREENIYKNKDPDKGIFMGIFNYPVLMASDILITDADYVPVGQDQKQHIDICNDISDKLKYIYGRYDIFKRVIPVIKYDNLLLPGTDGRKMSKNYNNVVSVFAHEKELKNYIYGIKTNSKEEGIPKFPEESNISTIHKLFSAPNEYYNFIEDMRRGKGWKELKDIVFENINNKLKPYRETYEIYKNNLDINFILNCEKTVKEIANRKLNKIKKLIGT
ncbi:MAG: tryptophan--tRNA ligase [bacterium]